MKNPSFSDPSQDSSKIKFRFIHERLLDFGYGLYLTGNVDELGQWKPQNSIKLVCYQMKYWICDVQIPIQKQIQYKFFVSLYQSQQNLKNISPVSWIGNQLNQNIKLYISRSDSKLIQHERKTKQLKIMSFNIRKQKEIDKNQYSWDMRKYNCTKVIKLNFPSIVGIQQATSNQRDYLRSQLSQFYDYVGIPSSAAQNINQQVGIFYDKQRFLVKQFSFRLGASYNPSQLFFVVLQDTYNSEQFKHHFHAKSSKQFLDLTRQLILCSNIYLHYHDIQNQKTTLQAMQDDIKQKVNEYQGQLNNVFLFGDFNLPENSNFLQSLQKKQPRLESIRKILLKKHMKQACDLSYTFHAFQQDEYDVQNPQKIIDHLYLWSKNYQSTKFDVIRQMGQKMKHSKNPIISDHYPIMGVFKHKRNQMKLQHLKA